MARFSMWSFHQAEKLPRSNSSSALDCACGMTLWTDAGQANSCLLRVLDSRPIDAQNRELIIHWPSQFEFQYVSMLLKHWQP